MTKPKVSIVVPVYNAEKFLEGCVRSITAQTLTDLEIILVDDGSREPCAKLCDALAKEDSRIRVIHKENGGAGLARNAGLALCSGEYVGFVDSDDTVSPEMYETLAAAAEKYSADLVLSGVCYVGGTMFRNSGEEERKEYFKEDTLFRGEDLKTLLLGIVGALPHEPDDSRYGVGLWKNLYRADVIRENGLQFVSEREYLSEDTLFTVDFVKAARSAVGIPGAFYRYYRNDTSISKAYKEGRIETCITFLGVLEERMKDAVSEKEYKIYLDRLTQGYGRILCAQEIVHAKAEKTGYSELRKKLKGICERPRIKAALKTYPWQKLPIKQGIFAFLMKHRLYFLQKIMVILRDR